MYNIDLHVHTTASGHAYSTLKEYIDWGKQHGMETIGFSDHGPAMPGGPNIFHIGNQTIIPRVIDGIRVLRGVEANILSVNGDIDISEKYIHRLDYCIASLHDVVIKPAHIDRNTQAIIQAVRNPSVDIIGHSGNPRFPIHIDAFVEACLAENKVIEINNSSFVSESRTGSKAFCYAIAERAKALGVKLILGSDAHIAYALGGFENSLKLLSDLNIDPSQVINTSMDALSTYFKERGRDVSEWG